MKCQTEPLKVFIVISIFVIFSLLLMNNSSCIPLVVIFSSVEISQVCPIIWVIVMLASENTTNMCSGLPNVSGRMFCSKHGDFMESVACSQWFLHSLSRPLLIICFQPASCKQRNLRNFRSSPFIVFIELLFSIGNIAALISAIFGGYKTKS